MQKCSEQLYDGKLGTAASDMIYVKALTCVVGKYLLICDLRLSSRRLKSCYRQRNSIGTDRKTIVLGNLCIMKAYVRYRQKVDIFSIKKYLPMESMISSCSKNSKHPW